MDFISCIFYDDFYFIVLCGHHRDLKIDGFVIFLIII